MAGPVVRLGIIGCGAATEQRHLPAARATREVAVVALADTDITRARRLGRRFGIGRCAQDYHQFIKDVDGMIIAVPNHLHAPVAGELLEMRISVLVEKPLTRTVEEARKLIALARASRVPLVRVYASSTAFSIEKARRVLGYDPKVGLAEGMNRTAAWIRWARL